MKTVLLGLLLASTLSAQEAKKHPKYLAVLTREGGDRRTMPVGGKKPSPFGVYDQYGNVWEWCADWAGPYSSEAATDPAGPANGDRKVLRGGGWNYGDSACRTAIRRAHNLPTSYTHSGFRISVR